MINDLLANLNAPSTDLTFILYVVIFVGILLAFEGLRNALAGSENEQESRNRRMRMLKKGATPEAVYELLSAHSRNQGLFRRLDIFVGQSGLSIRLRGLFLAMGATTILAWLVLSAIIPILYAQIAAVTIGILLPLIIVSGLRSRRLDRLARQLPDALDLMARGLRVGHPLPMTIESVATEMPDPVGSEFGLIHDQVSFGDTLVDAFSDMSERLGTEDVRYLAITVGIQYGTGGDLSRVLGVLAAVIRDRITMRKKIKAISAEGRISALVLSILPLMIFSSINSTAPNFYGDVWDDPIFLPAMTLILTLIVLQAIILFRMVKFDF